MKFNGFIGEFFPIWKSAQTDLVKVERWTPYLKDGIGKKDMRRQSTLQHTHSFSLFAGTAAKMMAPYLFQQSYGHQLDLLLLEYAFKWHDHAEGLKGRDIITPNKRDEDDVVEYIIFMKHIKKLPKVIREEYKLSFLLQFALNDNKLFDPEAQDVIDFILLNLHDEAVVFSALEKFEYLFYPIEMQKKHKYLLTWVIRRQISSYQKFAKILPGFREILFTESLEEQLLDYLKENKDTPAQQS